MKVVKFLATVFVCIVAVLSSIWLTLFNGIHSDEFQNKKVDVQVIHAYCEKPTFKNMFEIESISSNEISNKVLTYTGNYMIVAFVADFPIEKINAYPIFEAKDKKGNTYWIDTERDPRNSDIIVSTNYFEGVSPLTLLTNESKDKIVKNSIIALLAVIPLILLICKFKTLAIIFLIIFILLILVLLASVLIEKFGTTLAIIGLIFAISLIGEGSYVIFYFW